jgi:hypothetical protein
MLFSEVSHSSPSHNISTTKTKIPTTAAKDPAKACIEVVIARMKATVVKQSRNHNYQDEYKKFSTGWLGKSTLNSCLVMQI